LTPIRISVSASAQLNRIASSDASYVGTESPGDPGLIFGGIAALVGLVFFVR